MYRLFLLLSISLLAASAAASQPMRIVSSGGSITEIIYALDKQDLLVATDSTSLYPAAAGELPKLGYFRQLSAEGILSFQPTDFIGVHATGPETLATQLSGSGVSVSILGEQRDLTGLFALISQMGQMLGAEQKAQVLIDDITMQVRELKAQAQSLPGLTALFVMAQSDRGLTVAGGNTLPQALFNDAGMRNAAASMRDYKVMDNESILLADPDLVLVASHQIQGPQSLQQLCQHPALKATKAGRRCSIFTMDSSSAVALSPRYPQALRMLISASRPSDVN